MLRGADFIMAVVRAAAAARHPFQTRFCRRGRAHKLLCPRGRGRCSCAQTFLATGRQAFREGATLGGVLTLVARVREALGDHAFAEHARLFPTEKRKRNVRANKVERRSETVAFTEEDWELT